MKIDIIKDKNKTGYFEPVLDNPERVCLFEGETLVIKIKKKTCSNGDI